MDRSPALAAPLVITAFGGLVVALRTDDGAEAWRVKIGHLTTRLEVGPQRVVAVAQTALVVLDYDTGAEIRRIEVESGQGTLLVTGSRAYLSNRGEMTCVDLDEGTVLWRNPLPGTGFAPAAIGVPGKTVQADHGS